MPDNLRLDLWLVDHGFATTRGQARQLIDTGAVAINNNQSAKASQRVRDTDHVNVSQQDQWVSRGALKLAHAISVFDVNVSGSVCLDIGASTGGFTEVLLKNGAAKVYAVDVGRDQLHERLRENPAVEVLEQCNARSLTEDVVPEPIDVLVCDASFISLEKVLAKPLEFLRDNGKMLALFKPQFQVGKEQLSKAGVPKDRDVVNQSFEACLYWLKAQGLSPQGSVESPISGPKGNLESIIYATKIGGRRTST